VLVVYLAGKFVEQKETMCKNYKKWKPYDILYDNEVSLKLEDIWISFVSNRRRKIIE
jgi:hypothetical protein